MYGKSAASVISNTATYGRSIGNTEILHENDTPLQFQSNEDTFEQTAQTRRTGRAYEETSLIQNKQQETKDRKNDNKITVSYKTNHRDKFDINNLILNCIQRALSALKDPVEDSSRTTERLKALFKLLKNQGG